MSAEPRRYSFPPLERRGVVIGLPPASVATVAIGCLLAVGIVRRSSSTAGLGLAFLVAAAAAAIGCWPVAGRTPVAWLPLVAGWARRRRHGPRLAVEPTAGRALPASARSALGPSGTERRSGRGSGGTERRSGRSPGGIAAGVDIVAAPDRPGAAPLGVVRDRESGSWGAVVRVQGRSFALLDGADKERRLAAWGSVLASVGRPGSPVYRLQWVEQVHPGRVDDLTGYLAEAGVGPADDRQRAAREGYADLIGDAGPVSQRHGALLALTIHPRKAAGALRSFGRGDGAVCDLLRREVRLLVGQLCSAEIPGVQPLGRDELLGELAGDGGGDSRQRRRAAAVWPLATDEAWSALRADGGWHSTYWIAEWPRLDVGTDFLTPLLASGGRRRISLVMAPVDPQRAERQAGSAAAADLADEELRRRAGFVVSVRRQREASGVARRRAELADGHAEYRFSGYLTVSGGSRTELDQRCAEVEQAAQQSHLELRRLYGRQEEAYCWTLPLGRGLS